jgi:hypothetical protein
MQDFWQETFKIEISEKRWNFLQNEQTNKQGYLAGKDLRRGVMGDREVENTFWVSLYRRGRVSFNFFCLLFGPGSEGSERGRERSEIS